MKRREPKSPLCTRGLCWGFAPVVRRGDKPLGEQSLLARLETFISTPRHFLLPFAGRGVGRMSPEVRCHRVNAGLSQSEATANDYWRLLNLSNKGEHHHHHHSCGLRRATRSKTSANKSEEKSKTDDVLRHSDFTTDVYQNYSWRRFVP